MTNRDKVLEYLQLIAPKDATNSDIVSKTGIRPHPQVFMITRDLMKEGKIKGSQHGHEWKFWIPTSSNAASAQTPTTPARPGSPQLRGGTVSVAAIFEDHARVAMSAFYQTPLKPGSIDGVPKQFDLVSADHRIVGDAKLFSLVKGTGLPPAKFSIIAEYVWLLEKTNASHGFLVFGNDRRVPEE